MSAQQQPSTSFLSTLGRLAKEHHASVNAAHATYYNAPSTRRSSSSASASSCASSTMSKSPKDTAAVDAYSIAGESTTSSSASASASAKKSGGSGSAAAKKHLATSWDWVKERAREHHRGVNAAYAAHYSMGAQIPRPRK